MGYKNNSYLGPWERWRKALLGLLVVIAIALIVLVTIPIGVSALLLLVFVSRVWKPFGATNPTLGTYMVNTSPYYVARFFTGYMIKTREALNPRVSLGFGPPTVDIDHGLEVGWMPPTRLSAYWSLLGALILGSIDYLAHPYILFPFWYGATLPGIVSTVISVIAWFALIQSVCHVRRAQADGKGTIGLDPAPATMIHKVHADTSIVKLFQKSFAWGAAPAFLIAVGTFTAKINWTIPLIAIALSFTMFALVSLSRMATTAFRAPWRERNERREFWAGVFEYKRGLTPTLLNETKVPSFEEWQADNEGKEDPEPFSPNINIATFVYAPNALYGDYLRDYERLAGGLHASHVALSPLPKMDASNGLDIPGSISDQAFRVWWTEEENLTIEKLLDPETSNWTREFGVRSLILPTIASVRGMDYLTLVSTNLMTRKKSSAHILEIQVVPPPNINLATMISAIDSISTTLGVPWVRMVKSTKRDVNTITIMMGDEPTAKGIMFSQPPSLCKKKIDIANWSYYFQINGIYGSSGTPEYKSKKKQTDKVDEIIFTLPDGLSFERISGRIAELKTTSTNDFLEINMGTSDALKKKAASAQEQTDIDVDQSSKFTVIASKKNPLEELFFFGDYKDKVLQKRNPGWEKTTWHPGIMGNDQLATDAFDSDEPHLLIAGSSGSGKSVVIQNMIAQLAWNNGPEDLNLWLIEPKIGLGRFENLDVVTRFVDQWSPAGNFYVNVANTLNDALQEMLRRNQLMRSHPKSPDKLETARKIARREGPMEDGSPNPLMMPYLFIFIEECAAVFADAPTKEDRAAQSELISTAAKLSQQGRSAGVYLITSTQYPTNASIPSVIRNNMRRIGLSCRNGLASRIVIEENGLEKLYIKGTGMLKQGRDYRQFRGLYIRDDDPDEGGVSDLQEILDNIPKNNKPANYTDDGTPLFVPDPDPKVFKTWQAVTGKFLDSKIELGKTTKSMDER